MSGQVSLRVQVLGPVRAWLGEHEQDLGSPKQRAVFAVLAMNAGRPMPRGELAAAVWDAPTVASDSTLFTYISRLRAGLEPSRCRGQGGLLARTSSGYLLRVAPAQVDAGAFTATVAAARHARAAGDLTGAAAGFAGALRLWQGEPLTGLGTRWALAERARLTEDRLAAAEQHAEVRLALGGHSDVTEELTGLVASYPLREGLRRLLMLALYRSGRPADAQAVFQDACRVLAVELGTEPSQALRRLHEQMQAADPALSAAHSTDGGPGAAPRGGRGTGAGMGAMVAASARGVVPRELPADVHRFSGRAAELAELDRLLPDPEQREREGAWPTVVVTALSGAAGVGKTALALRWAHRVQAAFPDGQLYVNLRGYDPGPPMAASEVLAQFLRALGSADPDIPLEEAERAARFRSAVAGKRLLVLLDNASTVEQVRPLLPGSPTAMVIVTSRDSLAGLVARDGAHRLVLDLLPMAEAVALLWSLIGDRVADDPAAAETLADQCARLPLALRVAAELAVARPGTPLAELTAELASRRDRLALLDVGGDPRGAVASVFSWSYRHLPDPAGQMFRLLGLHPGEEWDHRAAAAIAGTTAPAASQLLAMLARAHLVTSRGPGRYGMHDLLRAYAVSVSEHTDSDTERRAALTRLFDYYLAACAHAKDRLVPRELDHRPDPPATEVALPELADRTSARGWLDTELPGLVAMAAYCAAHGWPTHTTRLSATLAATYLTTEHLTEGLTVFGHALAAAQSCGDSIGQARALIGLGAIHYRQASPAQALAGLTRALALTRDAGDRALEAHALGVIAPIHSWQGHYEQARECYQQALEIHREYHDQVGEGMNLDNLGLVDMRQGNVAAAARLFRQALSLFQEAGHRVGEANSLHYLGEACCRQGRYEQAAAYQQSALELGREVRSRVVQARASNGLGDVLRRQGRYTQALDSHRLALALWAEIGDHSGEADALNSAGDTLCAAGKPAEAHTSHAQALSLARQSGCQREQARALAGLAQACHAQGRHDDAASYRDQALALYRQVGDRSGETDALNAAGEALLATGEPGQALKSHQAAHDLARETGEEFQHARAHAGLAGACQLVGDMRQAGEHRRHAQQAYRSCGVPVPPEVLVGGTGPSVVAVPPAVASPGRAAGGALLGGEGPSVSGRPELVDSGGVAAGGAALLAGDRALSVREGGLAPRFCVLGPLEVRFGDRVQTPTAPKVRRVLALLVLRANQVVPTAALAAELWGEDPPATATATLQTYVYQVRRVLSGRLERPGDGDTVATVGPGYLLRAGAGQVDAREFEALARRGRTLLAAGQADNAAVVLRQALSLWRGHCLADVAAGPLLAEHVAHWEEARLRALELRILADATLGRHRAMIGELRSLVATHPLNEWFHGHLIAALGHAGRRGEALQAYQDLRTLLRDELGLEPRLELRRLQRDLLRDAPLAASLFTLPGRPPLTTAT